MRIMIVAVSVLSGCATLVNPNTPVGKFTLEDAQAASLLASKFNDTAGQKCYDYIAQDIKANGNGTFTPGALYLNEVKRAAIPASQALAAACGGVLPFTVSF